jgi:hypothetical protein
LELFVLELFVLFVLELCSSCLCFSCLCSELFCVRVVCVPVVCVIELFMVIHVVLVVIVTKRRACIMLMCCFDLQCMYRTTLITLCPIMFSPRPQRCQLRTQPAHHGSRLVCDEWFCISVCHHHNRSDRGASLPGLQKKHRQSPATTGARPKKTAKVESKIQKYPKQKEKGRSKKNQGKKHQSETGQSIQ